MTATSKKQPLYQQLVDTLREQIDNDMTPGALLPSERELASKYGLSRTTVRLALDELEGYGIVVRRHGKGTFVSEFSIHAANLISAYSFTEQMKELGRVPSTKILSFDVIKATRNVAENIHIPLNSDVYVINRLRLADGVPMMVGATYLPVSLFPNINLNLLTDKPLYDVLEEHFNQHIVVANEECFASTSRMDEAAFLNIGEGVPVLRIWRTTYNDKHQIIEYTRSVARGDSFKYVVSHVRNK